MYGGQCFGRYCDSMLRLQKELDCAKTRYSYEFLYNESLITRARNKLCASFLESNHSHFLFVDSDIAFEPDSVLKLMAGNRDILGAAYQTKRINWGQVREASIKGVPANQLRYLSGNLAFTPREVCDPPRTSQVFRVRHIATGFMMIKWEVLEKLRALTPTYIDRTENEGIEVHNFFQQSIDPSTNELLSEDYSFCELAARAGFEIWLDSSIGLAHIGTMSFESRF